ncbi:response regulator [Melioribacter sp. Ez-97]|uniref:response regulator n=1 Tax=Melioribacter sp. Ez-97 TaxID=3423434 RepID=UPI003EDB485D
MAIKILIVEDDDNHYELLERGFDKKPGEYILKRCETIADAMKAIEEFSPMLILSDWKLPDGNGTFLLQKDDDGNILIPLILMTSYGNETIAVESIKLGVMDYIVKSPDTFLDITHIVERTLREWNHLLEKRKIALRLNLLSHAVEQSKVIVLITDQEGYIQYVNPKFENVTGYKLDEAIGKKPSILKSGKINPAIYKNLWDTILSGKSWHGEFLNRSKFGEYYWESATISPIKNIRGKITHFIKISEDITEKKNMELTLKAALEKAEESNILKTSILSNMNHEIRTPLMGILGMTELMMEETADENLKEMLLRIRSSGKRLMKTLNSILDLSELESSQIKVKREDYNLTQNIEFIIEPFKEIMLQRKLDFKLVTPNEDLVVSGYKDFIEQSLSNILDNAIKYTPKGSITVYIDKELSGKKQFAKISISDTGIGIAKNQIGLIFQEFRQVSEGTSRSYEGAGLGLTTAKKMIELMDGTISVESKEGEGSTFTVLLQLAQPKEIKKDTPKEKIAESGNNFSILYVEDNIINQEVIKSFLSEKAEVDSALNAKEALKMIGQKKYSMILMDIHLGMGMDGIKLTKELRKTEDYRNTPIIAVTGYASNLDKDRFHTCGFNQILVKPFTKEELLDAIANLLKK